MSGTSSPISSACRVVAIYGGPPTYWETVTCRLATVNRFTAHSINLLRRIRAGPVGQGWVYTSPSPPMAKIGVTGWP
jgi:hypothetical protein